MHYKCADDHEDQKRESGSLELELQVVVSHLMQVMELYLGLL